MLVGVTILLHTPVMRRTGSTIFQPDMIAATTAMGAAMLWAILQTMPLDIFGPSNAFLSSSSEALALPPFRRLASGSEESITAIMRLLTYCGVFWLAGQFGRDARFARQLVWIFVSSATAVTLYGLAMQIDNGSCVVLNIVKAPIGSSCPFSGTFRNANNYATFAGMAAIVCVIEIQRRLLRVDPSSTSFRQRFRARLGALSGVGGVLGAALILLVVGLLLTGSKAAAAAFGVACVCTIALLNTAQRRGYVATIVSIAFLSVLILAMVSLGGEMLVTRIFQFFTFGDSDRLAIYSISLEAIGLRPFTGWGLGAFPGLFSVLQPPSMIPFYDKAHNTYLESAIELGIPAACCLLLAIAIPVVRCAVGAFQRSRDGHYPAMAIGVAVLVSFQSFFDFSIQIPAVAVAFSAVLGMGWAQSRSSRL